MTWLSLRSFDRKTMGNSLRQTLCSCTMHKEETSYQHWKDDSRTGSGIPLADLRRLSLTTRSSDQTTEELSVSSFLISNVIGIGGFGLVRVAIRAGSHHDKALLAIKSISKESVVRRSTNGLKAVLNELDAMCILKGCPFISEMKYAFQDAIFLYLVTSCYLGGDLRYNMKATKLCRFPEATAKFYIVQVLLALKHCHSHFILHRDIKPENLFMDSHGYIRVGDFGISKILSPSLIDECDSTSGTKGYLPPEVYAPTHLHGRTADIFSMGVCFHEFLTGRRPYEVGQLQAFRDPNHVTTNFDLDFLDNCAHVSSGAKIFLHQALHWDRFNRLGSNEGVLDALQHLYLQNMDIVSIANKQIQAPHIPNGNFVHCDVKTADAQEAIRNHCMASPVVQQHFFDNFKIDNHVSSERNEKRTSLSPLTIATKFHPTNEFNRLRTRVESSSSCIVSNYSK